MPCEFGPGRTNPEVACNTIEALKIMRGQYDGFSIQDLKEIFCDSSRQEDCVAHRSLSQHGRQSPYSK